MRNGFTRIALFGLLTLGGFVGLGTDRSSASTYLYTFTSPAYGSGYVNFTVDNTGLVTSASGQFNSIISPIYSGPITLDTSVSGATLGIFTFTFTNILSLTPPYFPAYSNGLGIIKIAGLDYEFNSFQPGCTSICDLLVGPPGYVAGFNISSESLTATPLPAALPLFATGLGAIGLLGWRRKRKAAALTAA
jgi:hypothetical protein